MTTTAEYRKLAALVKGWAREIRITAGDAPQRTRIRLYDTTDEMDAFSNEIVATVNIFSTILDAPTPQDAEEAAKALVDKAKLRALVQQWRDRAPDAAVWEGNCNQLFLDCANELEELL